MSKTEPNGAITTELTDVQAVLDSDDPERVFEDPYLTAAAIWRSDGDSDHERACNAVKDSELNTNSYRKRVKDRASELERDEREPEDTGPAEVPEPENPDVTLVDVRETVLDNFDPRAWRLTEAYLCTVGTLLLNDPVHCAAMVAEGPSSSGKGTVLSFFDGLDGLLYRSDSFTEAAMTSHYTDQDQVGENDLLPKVRHRALSVKDMSTQFSGDRDRVDSFMAMLANVMDGKGYTRDTGAQGSHGYEGDYRFALLGATTPLPPRAWSAMGHVGPRLLFHENPGGDSRQTVRDQIWSEQGTYTERIAECQQAVTDFMLALWHENGGYGSVRWDNDPTEQVQNRLTLLADLVAHGRAPVYDDENGHPEGGQPEEPHRVASSLKDIARARALIHGRDTVGMSDLNLCARVSLSTIPRRRRQLVRYLVDPTTTVKDITRSDVAGATGVSPPTAGQRMRLMDAIGIGNFRTVGEQGTEYLDVRPEFRNLFGDDLPLPEL